MIYFWNCLYLPSSLSYSWLVMEFLGLQSFFLEILTILFLQLLTFMLIAEKNGCHSSGPKCLWDLSSKMRCSGISQKFDMCVCIYFCDSSCSAYGGPFNHLRTKVWGIFMYVFMCLFHLGGFSRSRTYWFSIPSWNWIPKANLQLSSTGLLYRG